MERIELAVFESPGVTQQALAKKLDVKPSTVKYYMDKMKKDGKLKRCGTSQKGEWIILD